MEKTSRISEGGGERGCTYYKHEGQKYKAREPAQSRVACGGEKPHRISDFSFPSISCSRSVYSNGGLSRLDINFVLVYGASALGGSMTLGDTYTIPIPDVVESVQKRAAAINFLKDYIPEKKESQNRIFERCGIMGIGEIWTATKLTNGIRKKSQCDNA